MSQNGKSDCSRFNELPWHDSKLVGLKIFYEEEYGLQLDVQLRTGSKDGADQWRKSRLVFEGCRFVRADLDLLGMELCGGDIATASCERDSPLKKQVADLSLAQFDLPDDRNPFEETYHFQILMIHPGGEMNFFAKAFALELLA